jgi:transposase
MDSINDDAKGAGYRRIEVLTGPGRPRKWSDDDKDHRGDEAARRGGDRGGAPLAGEPAPGR